MRFLNISSAVSIVDFCIDWYHSIEVAVACRFFSFEILVSEIHRNNSY